jgi:hypothetical protein
MALPLTTDAVTCAWLSQAIGERYPGVAVLAAEPRETLWGTGTKLLLDVAYNRAGVAAGLPMQLCVKGGFADHREAMLFLYQLEARFFAELAPRLDIRVPRCLYAGSDGGQGIVILEDLHAAGATFCRVQQPLTRARTIDFLDGLAALHARFWNSPELDDPVELGWLVRHDPLPDDATGDYGRGQIEPESWGRTMALPRALALPNVCRDRVRMHAALQALRRFGAGGPTCLIHADAHLGNLFVDREGRAGFLDWQSARKGHWAQDVAYFLISALDPLDRRAWEHDLVRHYLDALARAGCADPPDEATAWEAIRAHIVYGLFYWTVNPVEWQVEVNNAAVAPRFAWAAVDHDAPPVGLG